MNFRFMIFFIFTVQADLIGWNRTGNTVRKYAFRRATAMNLIDQYQHFFNAKGENAKFIKSRRFIRNFCHP